MKLSKIIILLSLFIAGAFVGFFVAGRLAKQRIQRMNTMAEEPRREAGHLFRMLDLDSEQREQIRPIMDKYMPQHRSMRMNFHQQMDSLRNNMFSEIEPYLNADQKEQLEQLKKRRPPGLQGPRPRHRRMNPKQDGL